LFFESPRGIAYRPGKLAFLQTMDQGTLDAAGNSTFLSTPILFA